MTQRFRLPAVLSLTVSLGLAAAHVACSGSTTSSTSSAADGSAPSNPTGDAQSDAAAASPSGQGPASIPCDSSLFAPGDEKFVRSPTTEEFARYVKSYPTGEVIKNPSGSSEKGSAEFKASGELVMLGNTYAPTSICFDTVDRDPEIGNALLVFFTAGTAVLFERNSSYVGSLNE